MRVEWSRGSPYRYAWEGEGFASWAKTAPPP